MKECKENLRENENLFKMIKEEIFKNKNLSIVKKIIIILLFIPLATIIFIFGNLFKAVLFLITIILNIFIKIMSKIFNY